MDDRTPAPATNATVGPEEGRFDYGEAYSPNPALRYRQIKAVEGTKPARAYFKAQALRLHFSGCSVQEIAQTFGFSVDWAARALRDAQAEMREFATTRFDGTSVLAEHLTLYKHLRENAYFAMSKSGVTEVDKHRARESLMSVMRNEVEFVDRMGGFRGINLQGTSDDESVVAARNMATRIAALTDALEDAATGALDDEEYADPTAGSGPDADGLYADEEDVVESAEDVEDIDDSLNPTEGSQW